MNTSFIPDPANQEMPNGARQESWKADYRVVKNPGTRGTIRLEAPQQHPGGDTATRVFQRYQHVEAYQDLEPGVKEGSLLAGLMSDSVSSSRLTTR